MGVTIDSFLDSSDMSALDDLLLEVMKEKITSDDSDERLSAIKKLGQMGSEGVVDALIYVAEGRPRTYSDRSWKSVWFRRAKEKYMKDDQLAAIEALGYTGDLRVVKYLNRLIEGKLDHATPTRASGVGQLSDEHWDCRMVFPHAKGELKGALAYEYSATFNRKTRAWDYDHSGRTDCYKLIQAAIKRCEEIIRNRDNPENKKL